MAIMTQKEINERINDIERWVKAGNSQSPANCRIMLTEIHRLRALIKQQNMQGVI